MADQYNASVSVGADLSPWFASNAGKQKQKISNNIATLKELLTLTVSNNDVKKENTSNILSLYKEQREKLSKLLSDFDIIAVFYKKMIKL